MMSKSRWLVFVLLLFCFSCGKENETQLQPLSPPQQIEIDKLCRFYLKGEHDSLVNNMLTHFSRPQFDKQKLAMLLKQNEHEARMKGQFPVGVRYKSTEFIPNDSLANINVEILYTSGRIEKSMFRMIYKNERWWLR